MVFGGFASHSVAARIDDARPALIVSADAGARGGKILPYKKLLDDAIAQAQHQPKHVLLVDRGLAKMAWVDGRDLDFATLRQQHLGASVPVAWLESNETSCILYTSGTTGKPKGVQRDVGGYAVALATSMDTIFGGKAGGVFFCASDIGWSSATPISFTRRCWQAWRLLFTKDCRRTRTAGSGGKLSRNTRLTGCFPPRPRFAC
ncbi:propionate--CoA ligase [Salmonella enterica subsp. enterica serovar Daytona]|uniref:Propionate--CoA ligase n=1 Tax=Salmonella enterica subsp. enterica serovar Daytona TaxID=1962639 RepID=A0A447JMJ0_SALET|nr:propionate--CoA ligase [Salmonella enterica subsp. enterica serovar Daytona]